MRRCSGGFLEGVQIGSGFTLAGVVLDLVGELGDQLGSLAR